MTIQVPDHYHVITEDEAARLEEGARWFAEHPHTWETAGVLNGPTVFTATLADLDRAGSWLPADVLAMKDAEADFTAACERTVAPGRCTGCEEYSSELVPWTPRERLCWRCADLQLDLLAIAVGELWADASAREVAS